MDEFHEARWLQRWGKVDAALHFLLLLGALGIVTVYLWKELRNGGGHAP